MTGRKELVADSAEEPVSTSDFKTHAKVLNAEADLYITGLITAVRQDFEKATGLALVNQTWRLWFDAPVIKDNQEWWDGVREGPINFGANDALPLHPFPVGSVSSVKYYTPDNTEATLDSELYRIDVVSKPGRLILNAGGSWPSPLRTKNAIAVNMVCGYGAGANNVPSDIRHAIKMMAAHRFEHRGETLSAEAKAAEESWRRVVARYGRKRL